MSTTLEASRLAREALDQAALDVAIRQAEGGEFTGYAVFYGNKDRNGEVVDYGALTKCLREQNEFPLIWQHDRLQPVGVARLEETPRGAKVFAAINRATAEGEKAYQLTIPPPGFSRGALRDLSIGYFVKDDGYVGGVRHLKELEIFEVSLVTIAANPKTFITSVKDTIGGSEHAVTEGEDSELSELLAEIRADSAAIRSRSESTGDEAKQVLAEMRAWKRSRTRGHDRELESILAEMRGYNARRERQSVARRCYS